MQTLFQLLYDPKSGIINTLKALGQFVVFYQWCLELVVHLYCCTLYQQKTNRFCYDIATPRRHNELNYYRISQVCRWYLTTLD